MKYLKEHGVPEENIVYAENTDNTMSEVLFVKNYMIKNHRKGFICILWELINECKDKIK